MRNISSYDAAERQLCYIDSEQAHFLCADGSHEWRCVSCGAAPGDGACLVAANHVMAVFEVEGADDDDRELKPRPQSDCSLTSQDMRRIVGITEGHVGDPAEMRLVLQSRRRFQNQARASLRNRAVTVVPRMK